jgi:hypothetical protein
MKPLYLRRRRGKGINKFIKAWIAIMKIFHPLTPSIFTHSHPQVIAHNEEMKIFFP